MKTGDAASHAESIVEAGAPGAVVQVRTSSGVEVGVAGDARSDARFRIGSVTKTFTAALCLLAGLPLDERAGELVPGLPEVFSAPTLRQLLCHRSGIFDHIYDGERGSELLFDFSLRPDPWKDIHASSQHPLAFEAGTGFRYSNTNFQIAGLALERATGKRYGELLDRLICASVGLRRTGFCIEPRREPDLVRGYALPGGFAPTPDDAPADATTALHGSWADGAIVSDAADLTAFYAALLGGRLLPGDALQELLGGDSTGDGRLAGLGIFRFTVENGLHVWGHGGALPGYLTRILATQDGARVAAALANGQSPSVDTALGAAVRDLVRV